MAIYGAMWHVTYRIPLWELSVLTEDYYDHIQLAEWTYKLILYDYTQQCYVTYCTVSDTIYNNTMWPYKGVFDHIEQCCVAIHISSI